MTARVSTWPWTEQLRLLHLTSPATDAACRALAAEVEPWLATQDQGPRAPGWWTAQLRDGRIVGTNAATELAAQVWIEIWWGAAVHWLVRDPDCTIHDRYLGAVSSEATRSPSARTFPLSDDPLEYPFRAGEEPAYIEVPLFTLEEASLR